MSSRYLASTELSKHLHRGFFSRRFNCMRCRIASARYCGCLPRVCGFATRKLSSHGRSALIRNRSASPSPSSSSSSLYRPNKRGKQPRARRDEELAISLGAQLCVILTRFVLIEFQKKRKTSLARSDSPVKFANYNNTDGKWDNAHFTW